MVESKTPFEGDVTTVYAALEVSGSSWILAVGDPSDTSKAGVHRLAPHDVDGLLGKLGRARERAAATGGDVRVMLVYEAGYEGFWLVRRLGGEDLEVVVRHPAGLEVVRGKKKVRTDRIDARRMVRALRAWDGGDRDAMSRVRVPTVAEEDGRRLLRRRERLVKERRRLANAVGGLLRLHGLCGARPERPGFRERLGGMETGYGTPLPPELMAEIGGILDRLDLVAAELKVVEARKMEVLEASGRALGGLHADAAGAAVEAGVPPTAPAPRKEAADPERAAGKEGSSGADPSRTAANGPQAEPANAHHAAAPGRLRGIGPNDALMLGGGPFHREFRNRRQLSSPAGLAPVPFASGGVDHDQGISKTGSAMLRRHLVQMAWRWLRYQPESALSAWFRSYVSARDGRSRRRGIVALARKLLVALWRFATTGLVPEGAVLSQARAREGNGTTEHPGGPTGPPGNPGRACDRSEPWFAAGRGTVHTDGSRPPERRTARIGHCGHGAGTGQPNRTGGWTRWWARHGTATFRLDGPRWHGSRPRWRNRGCEAMKGIHEERA